MIYRRLGKTNLEVSIIGVGTEYLVKASPETVNSVVHAAVERGINYFDVLFAYPDYRDNFGKAFRGLRDKVIITGHLPVNDSIEACRLSFMDHLQRLQIDFVDILFVSCCDGEENFRRAMRPGGHYALAAEMVAEGKAKYIGFSSHTVPVALQAIESGKFDLLMFPINPSFDVLSGETGTDNLENLWEKAYFHLPEAQARDTLPERKRLYQACSRDNIGLVAMKPFAGGWLFKPELETGFNAVNLIHYALCQPGVSCVIPGVASLEQLEQDLIYLDASEDQKDFSSGLARSRWSYQGSCMYCDHCQPCTAGIEIREVNRLLDLAKVSPLSEAIRVYQDLQPKASDCEECGDCMERCPFNVDVIERMREAVRIFENAVN